MGAAKKTEAKVIKGKKGQDQLLYPQRKEKEITKFLDTYGIFKMSLKDLGQMINEPKLEPPTWMTDENTKITPEKIQEMKPYNIQDTIIVLKSIQ